MRSSRAPLSSRPPGRLGPGIGLLLVALLASAPAVAQETALPPTGDKPLAPRVSCPSRLGERNHCAADTTKGVALLKSTGEAACLLGKTWGYDDAGIWVSDGCVGEFVVGQALSEAAAKAPPVKQKA